uniref:Uncharacterized protein n=1 Tax=Leersia perrieri TaxID=77586 RepID=A0A0D9W8K4_9ORYZ
MAAIEETAAAACSNEDLKCFDEELDEEYLIARCARMRLSQQNIDWILARSELCTDDAPNIWMYIPFNDDHAAGEPLPDIYHDNPEALFSYINDLCMSIWDRFRDFQSWVRAEFDSNGFVDVCYDYQDFEQRQHRKQKSAKAMAELLADILETGGK